MSTYNPIVHTPEELDILTDRQQNNLFQSETINIMQDCRDRGQKEEIAESIVAHANQWLALHKNNPVIKEDTFDHINMIKSLYLKKAAEQVALQMKQKSFTPRRQAEKRKAGHFDVQQDNQSRRKAGTFEKQPDGSIKRNEP